MKKYVYSIWVKQPGLPWEKIDDTYNERDAWFLVGEYRLVYGKETVIQVRHHGEVYNF